MNPDKKPDERVISGPTSLILQYGAVAVAVFAMVIPVYLGTRVQAHKEMGLRYIASRPVVDVDVKGAPDLHVTYRGEAVVQLWLISAKLENIGNVPIEKEDIEQFLTLEFPRSAKIFDPVIVDKNPPVIEAQAVRDENIIQIQHGLMNPGNWIAFDIFSDGNPGEPKSSLHISGIPSSTPRVLWVTGEEPVIYATGVSMERPMQYFVLTLTSLGALFAVGFGVYGFGYMVTRFIPKSPRREIPPMMRSHLERLLSKLSVDSLEFDERTFKRIFSERVRVLIAALKTDAKAHWIDEPSELMALIQQHIPVRLLEAYELDAESATNAIVQELRSGLPGIIAHVAFQRLPSGPDNRVREDILRLDFPEQQNTEQYVARVREIIENIQPAEFPEFMLARGRSIELTELVAVVLLLAFGVSAALVAAGTWRTLLAV